MEPEAVPRYVVDTSVALKWFVEAGEKDVARARELREAFVEGRCILRAPDLLPVELTNALKVGRRLASSDVVDAVESIFGLGSFLESVRWPTLRMAIDICSTCDAAIYDSYFLAMALESDSLLVTADEDFLRKARRYPSVVALGRLQPLR